MKKKFRSNKIYVKDQLRAEHQAKKLISSHLLHLLSQQTHTPDQTMQARQSIPAQIFHAARAANIPTTEETNEILLTLGESLAAASSSIPFIKISNLEILANIGVSYNPLQLNILKNIQETANVNVPACLTTLEEHLTTITTGGPYLLGTSLSSIDCILFCASAPILTLVQTIRPYPKVGQWFNNMTSSAWCSDIVGAKRALGTVRIGGQIDLRPNPIDSYAAAMKSIQINHGYKKKKRKSTSKHNSELNHE